MFDKQQYIKKFKFLTSYDSKKGLTTKKLNEEESMDDQLPVLDDETNSEEVDVKVEKPSEYENTEEVEKIKKEEELAKKTDIDRVKEIQDMQTEKIGEIEQLVAELSSDIEQLSQKTVDIDAMKTNLDILRQQVKDITPPTPEESLERMAKISGGITVEDYWVKYFEENKPYKTVVNTETQEEEKTDDQADKNVTYVVSVKDIKSDYNESEIKNSMY